METRKDPWIAGILSFFLAGAGHIYCGKVGVGILFIIIDIVLYVTTAGIGALIFGVIVMITSIQLAKEINEKIDQQELATKQVRNNKREEEVRQMQNNQINVVTFIDNLKNKHKLFINEIYSEEEYLNKKNIMINDLYSRKITCDVEDFLTELISLKKQGIITMDDITKIKNLIM